MIWCDISPTKIRDTNSNRPKNSTHPANCQMRTRSCVLLMDIFLQPRASKDAEIGYGMVQSYVCPTLDNSKHDFSENTWAIKNTPFAYPISWNTRSLKRVSQSYGLEHHPHFFIGTISPEFGLPTRGMLFMAHMAPWQNCAPSRINHGQMNQVELCFPMKIRTI